MKSLRFATAVALLCLAACGDRPDVYEAPFGQPTAYGLERSVAILDDGAQRVLLLSPSDDRSLVREFVKVGPNVSYVATSFDKKRLFVLSAGDQPREVGKSERPSLTVIERTADAKVVTRRFDMESAHRSIAVDPSGRYLAVYDGAGSKSGDARTQTLGTTVNFVSNPNELIVIDLFESDPARAIVPRTIRSFGGKPQRIHFTDPLTVPAGPRRLLVAEGTSEVTLLDLSHLHDAKARPEVTVRLPQSASQRTLAPVQVVWNDGAKDRNDDARIAIRLAGDPNVLSLTLGAPAPGATNDFATLPNLADVGGVPSDIAFVQTDLGTRIAALVPTARAGVLVEPDTSTTQSVSLGASYTNLALVRTTPSAEPDVALLYGASAAGGVAFWTLGRIGTEAHRSIEPMDFGGSTTELVDIPDIRGTGSSRKILKGPNDFIVLDLATRSAAPLSTPGSYDIYIGSQGSRIWAYEAGGTRLAQVDLATLHPRETTLYGRIDRVFELPTISAKRQAIAVDLSNGVNATVLEGDNPDVDKSTSYASLLLEGLQGAVR